MDKPYSTKVTIVKIDEDLIPAVQKVMNEHPRIKRVLKEKGIYLYAEDITGFIESYNDEIVMRISVSIGNIEQDCFNVGYYGYSKYVTIEEIVNQVCKEDFFGFTCRRMINSYAPIHLGMPAPCELEIKYHSTDEEKVDISYINESTCHAIIGKLWKYARFKEVNGSTFDELVNEIGLTDDEFHVLMNEYD